MVERSPHRHRGYRVTFGPRRRGGLSECLGPWQTIWKRHDRWAADEAWNQLLTDMRRCRRGR
jgi:hypothetical protein